MALLKLVKEAYFGKLFHLFPFFLIFFLYFGVLLLYTMFVNIVDTLKVAPPYIFCKSSQVYNTTIIFVLSRQCPGHVIQPHPLRPRTTSSIHPLGLMALKDTITPVAAHAMVLKHQPQGMILMQPNV